MLFSGSVRGTPEEYECTSMEHEMQGAEDGR